MKNLPPNRLINYNYKDSPSRFSPRNNHFRIKVKNENDSSLKEPPKRVQKHYDVTSIGRMAAEERPTGSYPNKNIKIRRADFHLELSILELKS